LTNRVNGQPPILPTLFEFALVELRAGLYRLSDSRFTGLRTRHYRLLGFIPDEGIRMSRIAEASGLTKQALAQALAPLQDGGYVMVGPDPADRRARVVRRSARGDEVVTALRRMQAEYERRWSARVGADRWATTRDVLGELFGDAQQFATGTQPSSGRDLPARNSA
jgi:DNA-binding MarR family transcriptional regulator